MTETPAPPSLPLDSLVAQLADEFTQRQKRGEQPDVEEYAACHPEHAAVIRNVLASLQLIRMPAAPDADDDPLSGRLGDFRLIREIGRGGMGLVYEAEQVSLGRRVALKVLPLAATLDARQLQRFKNEARAAAQLHHTNIVPVYFVDCERGVHFYAMQYIEGHSLAEVISDLRFRISDVKKRSGIAPKPGADATTPHVPQLSDPSEIENRKPEIPTKPLAGLSTIRSIKDAAFFRTVAELGIQAAEALDCAHQQGIVHRDIKPANLMVQAEPGASTPGVRLWITDFGLAQVQSDTRLTMTGDLVGTLRYMSPEQALAKRVVVDHRTDVYSLGVTLYELLTLEPAFTGTDRHELLRQIAFDEPRPPRRLNKAIPAELEIIVLKAIEKNPTDRYATAKELADDLRRFLMHEPIRARRPTVAQRAIKWTRRHRAATTAAVVCLIVTLGATLASVGYILGDRTSRKRQAEIKVLEALDAAKPALEEGNPWDRDLVSALRQAEAHQSGGLLSPELRRRVEQLQTDVAMLAELESIRLRSARLNAGRFDVFGSVSEFSKALQGYGIEIVKLEPEEAAALLETSAIEKPLLEALYEWAGALMRKGELYGNHEAAERIMAVARQLDSGAHAKQLQAAVLSRDKLEWERLLQAAPTEEVSAKVCNLGLVVIPDGLDGGASVKWIESLRRAQAGRPTDFWINTNLAFALTQTRPPRLEEAVGFFRVAVALHPDSPGAHLNLAAVLLGLRRVDESILECRKATDLEPNYAEARSDLGNALRVKGLLDEAVTESRIAVRIKPELAAAHGVLGAALHSKKELEEATAEFRKAIDLSPNSAIPHTNLGLVFSDKGLLDEAIAEHRKAIELDPTLVGAHEQLGIALHEKRNLDEAIAEYQKVIDLKPDYADAHYELAVALRDKGKLDEAIS